MKPSFSIHPDFGKDNTIEPRWFTFRELIGTTKRLNNYPDTFTQLGNLRALADFLDGVRDELGVHIFVNSAFRTPEVNAAVDGAHRSLHMQGRAADIWTHHEYVDKLIEILRKHRTELSEFIVNREKKYIHVAI